MKNNPTAGMTRHQKIEYEIYSKMRSNLIHDIKAITKEVIAKKDEIVEIYKEFAGNNPQLFLYTTTKKERNLEL